MKANISRHNRKADWHIRCANDLWKVYDKEQKFRCSFRTRAEAERYIDLHCTRRPTCQPEPIYRRDQPSSQLALLDA
jgi:hypothetical protein